MISKDEVKKLAELSLLKVEDSELEALTGEMDAILEYISDIETLASDAPEVTEPELFNVMREDAVTNTPGEYTEKILDNAPDTDGRYVRVKKIL